MTEPMPRVKETLKHFSGVTGVFLKNYISPFYGEMTAITTTDGREYFAPSREFSKEFVKEVQIKKLDFGKDFGKVFNVIYPNHDNNYVISQGEQNEVKMYIDGYNQALQDLELKNKINLIK